MVNVEHILGLYVRPKESCAHLFSVGNVVAAWLSEERLRPYLMCAVLTSDGITHEVPFTDLRTVDET